MAVLDRPGPAHAGFLTFAEAREAAEDHGAAHRHRMHWLTWGSPPRSGRGVCERCGRDLWVERTRAGAFRLHGSALRPCAPPSLALSYTLDIARPTAMRLVSPPGARARDAPPARPA